MRPGQISVPCSQHLYFKCNLPKIVQCLVDQELDKWMAEKKHFETIFFEAYLRNDTELLELVIKGQTTKFIQNVILVSDSYKRTLLKALLQFHFDIPGLEPDLETNLMVIHENLLDYHINVRLRQFLSHFKLKWLCPNKSDIDLVTIRGLFIIAILTGRMGSAEHIIKYTTDPMGNYIVAAGCCRRIDSTFRQSNHENVEYMIGAETLEAMAILILTSM